MKQIVFILLTLLILGCSQNRTAQKLLGTWELVYVKNIETGELEFPNEYDDLVFLTVNSDSIYLDTFDRYGYEIKGDSILLNEYYSVYIKNLTNQELIVEFDFFNVTQLKFKKK